MDREQEVTEKYSEIRFPRGKLNYLDIKRKLVENGRKYGFVVAGGYLKPKHQYVLPTILALLRDKRRK